MHKPTGKHRTLVSDNFLLVLLNAIQEVSEKEFVVQPGILFQGLSMKARRRWATLPDDWPPNVGAMNERLNGLTAELKDKHKIVTDTAIKDGALCWRFRKQT